MPRFDLLTEPWIPVLDAGTSLRDAPDAPVTTREVGLREALLRAHELREVAAASPLQTIALYRVLLALAVDVYQPEPDEDAWARLWREGCFEPEPLEAYLVGLPHKGGEFDLLHPERPFLQDPQPDTSTDDKDPSPVALLFHDRASGNNATLFDHAVDAHPQPVPLAEAARGVVAIQAAALGGGASKPFYFSHAPLVGRLQFWIRGRSLFEALLLNAPPDEKARMNAAHDDAPAWRRALPDPYSIRRHRGLRDVLAWPSRRLTLLAEERDGQTLATGVYLTQGDKLDASSADDPFAAYVTGKKGTFPLGLRSGRALWRDAAVLTQTADATGAGAPYTFHWAMAFAPAEMAEHAADLDVAFRTRGADAFGLVNDQAKSEMWRHTRFPLYRALFTDEDRRAVLTRALEAAENQWSDEKKGLRVAIKTLGDFALAPPAPGDDAYPSSDSKAVRALAQSLGAEPRYWAALETPFFAFLGRLADAADPASRQAALDDWHAEVFAAARSAFAAATASFDADARHLRAVAKGRARLRPVTT